MVNAEQMATEEIVEVNKEQIVDQNTADAEQMTTEDHQVDADVDQMATEDQQPDVICLSPVAGLFMGSFIMLFVLYALLGYVTEKHSPKKVSDFMGLMYPLFSMMALLSLHLFMYGCNLLTWNRTRINFNFIFNFKPDTTFLTFMDAIRISTSMIAFVIAAMLLRLISVFSEFQISKIDYIPYVTILIFVFSLVCPFNILHRSTRYRFFRIIRNIMCSPFCEVLMVDIFMADQLTSQITSLRHMEMVVCNLVTGSSRRQQYTTCTTGKLYRELAYAISFAPYYWRVMQCVRRWMDEHNITHLANLGKYLSAMLAGGARLVYARESTYFRFGMVCLTSVIATLYQLFWDFFKDWGLVNRWHKKELLLKKKSKYYIAIVVHAEGADRYMHA